MLVFADPFLLLPSDVAPLADMIKSHAWIPIGALVVGLLVRFMKSDSPLPEKLKIDPKYRAWAAIAFGVVLVGVLEPLTQHAEVLPALIDGLFAGFMAITGHETIVEGLRNGREFFTPKPKTGGGAAGGGADGAGPSDATTNGDGPPNAARSMLTAYRGSMGMKPATSARSRQAFGSRKQVGAPVLTALLVTTIVFAFACTPTQKQDAKTVLNLATDACVVLSHVTNDGATQTICATEQELAPIVDHLLAARAARAALASGKPGLKQVPEDACLVEMSGVSRASH